MRLSVRDVNEEGKETTGKDASHLPPERTVAPVASNESSSSGILIETEALLTVFLPVVISIRMTG